MNIINSKNKISQIYFPFSYIYKGKIINTNITEITSVTTKIIKSFFNPFNVLAGRTEIIIKSGFNNNLESMINNNKTSLLITIPYYTYDNKSVFTTEQFYGLQQQISQQIKIPVEIKFILLQEPYMDAIVIAQYISNELEEGNFFKVMSVIMGIVSPVGNIMEQPIVSTLIGIKVKISGRLNAERSQPRITKQSIEIGSFKLSNKTNITISSYTTSNKKGSNTVRVWLSHLM